MLKNWLQTFIHPQKIDPDIKVLIIEDSHSDSDLVKIAVKYCGFSSLVAFDGNTGVKMAQELNPRLIVLDYNLPDINGSQVLKQLRSLKATTYKPVLVISAFDSSDVILNSFENGADHYLKKPFSINLLADKITLLIKSEHQN